NGAETITFKATDPGALHDDDGATFTVTAVNDTPVVSDIPDQTINEGESFATINLDDYVSDVDNTDAEMTWTSSGNSELSVSIVNRVATIIIPDADWNGAETITFRATDPGDLYNQDEANFTVTGVNDAPVVSDIPDQTINEGETFATIALDDYVMDVDNTDAEMVWTHVGDDDLNVSIIDRLVTISVPDVDWNGSETINFKATDPGALHDENAATFTVLAVNDAPVADAQSVSTDEDTAKAITLTGSDVEDDELTYEVVDTPTHGTLSGTAPDLIYTPDADYFGDDSFTFKVNDGAVDSAEAMVSITVNPVNDAPVAVDDATSTAEDTALVLSQADLTGNDTDVDNLSTELSVMAVGNPVNGAVVLDAGVITFTPDQDFVGPAEFDYTVSDGVLMDEGHVLIDVTAVNDAPVITEGESKLVHMSQNGDPIPFNLTLHATDTEDDELAWSIISLASHGEAVAGGTGVIGYTPDEDFTGDDSFVVQVSDGNGGVDTILINVSITPFGPVITVFLPVMIY
ncbi:MAG: tandem-95 repeat protein, partial [Anaerolineales bacterium]|nr:tandem-95 repeat protein [Anaerolineales bacterium]